MTTILGQISFRELPKIQFSKILKKRRTHMGFARTIAMAPAGLPGQGQGVHVKSGSRLVGSPELGQQVDLSHVKAQPFTPA